MTRSAHNHPWKISDVVIFPAAFVGLAAEWFMPTSFGIWRPVGIALGVGMALGGFRLIQLSKRQLVEAKQPVVPGTPTTRLVTSGPYRWSRNPNYLGAIVAVLGGALIFDTLWLIASAVLSAAIIDLWLIRPEERYLSDVFGDEYDRYRKTTRRWL